MSASLEQERLDLLKKIRSSRTSYEKTMAEGTGKNKLFKSLGSQCGIPNFPKSMTFQWIDNHLLLTTAIAGCCIYLATQTIKSQGISDVLAKQSHYFLSVKKSLNRIFKISTTILNNPEHQHIVKFLVRAISNRLSK